MFVVMVRFVGLTSMGLWASYLLVVVLGFYLFLFFLNQFSLDHKYKDSAFILIRRKQLERLKQCANFFHFGSYTISPFCYSATSLSFIPLPQTWA